MLEKETKPLLDKDLQQKPTTVQFLEPDNSSLSIEENMPDYETVSSPKDEIKAIPITKIEFYQKIEYESLQASPSHAASSLLAPPCPSVFFPHIPPEVQEQARVRSAEKPEVQLEARVGSSGKPKNDEVAQFDARSMPLQFIPARDERGRSPVLPANSLVEDTELKHMFDEENEDEELVITGEEAETNELAASYYDEEVAEAKLKLIIRCSLLYMDLISALYLPLFLCLPCHSQEMEATFFKEKGDASGEAVSIESYSECALSWSSNVAQ